MSAPLGEELHALQGQVEQLPVLGVCLLGLLQLPLVCPQSQLLVRLQLRGQVVEVAQLLVLQGGVGRLQVLYLCGGEVTACWLADGTVVWSGTL